MRKFLLALLCIACIQFTDAQDVIVAYEFETPAPYPDPVETDENVSASALTFGTGINASRNSTTGVLTTSNYNPGNLSGTDALLDYIQIVITPDANYKVTVANIFLNDVRRSSNGPTKILARASLNGFTNNEYVSATNEFTVPQTPATDAELTFLTPLVNITTPITIRIYGYASGGGSAASRQLLIGGSGVDIAVEGIAQSLPVRFANIKAVKQANGVQVSFSNLTEEDVATYVIERSANGRSFTAIGEVAPKFNHNARADYSFLDKAPLSGDNFYRIRAVEGSGKVVYSTVVKINTTGAGSGLVVFPNPVRGSEVSFVAGNLPAGSYQLRVFNTAGQLVHAQALTHGGGSISQSLSLRSAKAGQYVLEVNGAVRWLQQFVIQ